MLHRPLLSIGDVARLTGIRPGTLRSWETAGLLFPVRTAAGQRRYGPEQIDRIRTIEALRRVQGYNLNAIRAHLATHKALAANTNDNQGHPDDAPTDQEPDLSVRIRALRREKELTVRELARRAGVAASFVSMIERKRAAPSATTLNALARGLGVTLANLLGSTDQAPTPVVRAGTGRVVDYLGPAIQIEQLTVGRSLIDSEVWTLAPGAQSQGAYAHRGEELIRVLDGQFEISLDGGAPIRLEVGDTIQFDSAREHQWRNPGTGATRLMWVQADPSRIDNQDRPGNAVVQAAAQATLPPDCLTAPRNGTQAHPGLTLPDSTRVYRYLDTHTAGHPTRIFLDTPAGLPDGPVHRIRGAFRAEYDHLRTTLLHEPRGHAATFGLIPVPSARADYGAIFVSSYAYLDMCGHATIGFARALDAWGLLNGRDLFTLETPAGVITVHVARADGELTATIVNVPCYRATQDMPVILDDGRTITIDVVYGGCWYALVDAEAMGERLCAERVTPLMALGAQIKTIVNDTGYDRQSRGNMGSAPPPVDSVLFHAQSDDGTATRQLVVLEANKFDRSPCGTGMSARMAQLHAQGHLSLGETYMAENILGVRFSGEIVQLIGDCNGAPGIRPSITGEAYVSGMGALVLEPGDPLPEGFLCR